MIPFSNQHCPACGTALWAPDNEPIGSKKCPRCGSDLWVLIGAGGPIFFVKELNQSESLFLAVLLDISADEAEQMLREADSFDLVELVLEVEEKLRSNRR